MRSTELPNSRRAARRALYLVAAVAAIASCESPTAPSTHSNSLEVGVVANKRLSVGDSVADYSFVTEPGVDYVVYATVEHGTLFLTLEDSTHNGLIGAGYAGPGSAALMSSPVFPVYAGSGGTRELTVRRDSVVSSVAFKLLVYGINNAPENRPAAITIGDTVSGETLEPAQDVDVFTADLAAGQDIVVAAEAPGITGLGPIVLTVVDPSATPISITSFPTGTPASLTTGRLHVTAGGRYQFRFQAPWDAWSAALAFHGAYRFWTYAINRAPEHLPAAIVPGDTISGESIDRIGDLDEFTFSALAGEDYYAFLQTGPAAPGTQLQLDAVDPLDTLLASVLSANGDPTLLGQVTTVIHAQTTGTYRLRVGGAGIGGGTSTGPYRLLLYRVNRQPESVPPTLALGDSLFGESIDSPGDVDEFRVHVADSTGANFFIAAPGIGSFELAIADSVTGQVLAAVYSNASGAAAGVGAMALKPGTYIVRVHEYAWDGRPHLRGAYSLRLFGFSFRTETVSDTIAIGDTVQAESIDVPGDQDTYHFHAVNGQHINVMIQALGAAATTSGVSAFITGPSGPTAPLAVVGSGPAAAALADHQTTRMDISATGWYTMSVSSGSSSPALTDRGPYRIAVVSTPTAPESHGANLAIGDSVTTESIGVPGDWDEYTVTGTPGQEVYALLANPVPCCFYPTAMVSDPATGDTLALNVAQGTRILGPFTLPASGVVALSAFEYSQVFFRQCYDATCGNLFGGTGPYTLQLIALNRAPETAPAAFTIGDTVGTEALAPAGDIDEFTTAGTPGDTLTVWFRVRADVVPAGAALSIIAFDPAADPGSNSNAGFFGQSFIQTQAVVVPPSGQLRIRVFGYGPFGTSIETAPYAFFLKRGP